MGAGMMGAGIAYVSRAMAGIEVVLIDARTRGRRPRQRLYRQIHGQRHLPQKGDREKKAAVLSLITATTDYAALKGLRSDRRGRVRRRPASRPRSPSQSPGRHRPPIASSPPTPRPCRSPSLAKASVATQEQFIGIHFFSPVDKMLLVEIIKGQETGDRAVAKALDFVRQIRKTRSWSTTRASSMPTAASSPTSTKASAWSPRGRRARR